MKAIYLLFVIGLCGCTQGVTHCENNDGIECRWDNAYSNVTITAVRDGKVIQIGSPRSDSAFSAGEVQQLKSFVALVESSTNSKISFSKAEAVQQ